MSKIKARPFVVVFAVLFIVICVFSLFNCLPFDATTIPAIHYDAYYGKSKRVSVHLKRVDVNLRDHSNKTPLHWACEGGHLETVKLLVENGANLEATSSVGYNHSLKTPLYYAAKNGNTEVISYLLSAGASVEKTPNALGMAILYGRLEAVKLLIEHGIDINYADSFGNTPILDTAGCFELPERENNDWKINPYYIDIIELLINSGADVFDENAEGNTTLIYAAMLGNVEAVKIFYNLGVSIDHQNKEGLTALDYAREREKTDTLTFLLENGA